MRAARYFILAALGLFLVRVSAAGETSWRVVVQDCHGEALAATPDGVLVVVVHAKWSRTGTSVVHVTDMEAARTVLTVHVPGAVHHAAISGKGRTLAISTQDEVHLADMATGRSSLLLTNAGGALALDDDGDRLAVLGRVPFATDEDRDAAPVLDPLAERFERTRGSHWGYRGYYPGCRLGIYDIRRRRWIARVFTHAVRTGTVCFEGEKAMGVGIGGTPGHMLPRVFTCHTALDPQKGEVSSGRGPTRGIGRPLSDEHKRKEREAGYYDYVVPTGIQTKQDRLEKVKKKVSSPEVLERLKDMGIDARPFRLACIGDADRVRFAASYWFTSPRGWHATQFAVGNDGTISCGPLLESTWVDFGVSNGRLFMVPRRKPRFIDLATGQEALAWVPPMKVERGTHLLPTGILRWTWAGGAFKFHGSKEEGATWSAEFGDRSSYCLSGDGTQLAVHPGKARREVVVLDVRTGEELSRTSLAGLGGEKSAMIGFDHDVVVFSEPGRTSRQGAVIRMLGLEDGKRMLETEAEGMRYCTAAVPAGRGRWLVSSGYWGSRLLDSMGRWSHEFSLDHIDPASSRSLPARAGDRLLVETDSSQEPRIQAVIDLADGRVIDSHACGGGYALAFGDRVLVRPSGLRSEVEFIGLKSMSLLFTLHPVPLEKGFGWIVTTPDGRWDASPGVEGRVAAFRNGTFAGDEGTASRRRTGLVGERLRAFLSKAKPSQLEKN